LIESPGVPVVVAWAGPQELAWARTIVAGGGDRAHLAPATTLAELAELSRRASVVVASDTGPLHLAAALGTPCVGLFGPMPATRNGPYGLNHVALQNVCLAGSSRERRGADDASMRAISAAEVCAACRAILAPAECGNQPQAA
jgi:ADP-heptose:LPS heptosyltransferase